MDQTIAVPPWADALFKLLDQYSPKQPITPKVEDGSIQPDDNLGNDLGISTFRLQSIVGEINKIIRNYRRYGGAGSVSNQQLSYVASIGDLANLVAKYL